MKLFQVRIFLAVADAHSYDEAAEELFVSVRSARRAVKSLEQEMHTRFFSIQDGRQVLTKSGEVFYGYAQEIVTCYNEILKDAERASKPTSIT